jgi:alkylresorcinol/alkylpyrone synthase
LVSASIIGIGTAAPVPVAQQDLWDGFFADHFGDDRRARAIFRRSGIESRGGQLVPMDDDVSAWSTEQRMERFLEEAMPLARTAAERCLAHAGLEAGEVELLAVVSCTGYTTPGIDVLLTRDLGMAAATQRLHIGHMGCFAAIPALAAVHDAAVARNKTGVLVCVEVASLHVQPPTDDVQQQVAHALFADAAAALAIGPDQPGLRLVDVVSRTDVANAEHMTWDVTDHGFRMGLSPKVPAVLAEHVAGVVEELLDRHELAVADIAGWAVHPGGPKILDVVGAELHLTDELDISRAVLARHGNTSSASVLLILEQVNRSIDLRHGDHVVCMAFGPGLTLYAALLQRDDPASSAP